MAYFILIFNRASALGQETHDSITTRDQFPTLLPEPKAATENVIKSERHRRNAQHPKWDRNEAFVPFRFELAAN